MVKNSCWFVQIVNNVEIQKRQILESFKNLGFFPKNSWQSQFFPEKTPASLEMSLPTRSNFSSSLVYTVTSPPPTQFPHQTLNAHIYVGLDWSTGWLRESVAESVGNIHRGGTQILLRHRKQSMAKKVFFSCRRHLQTAAYWLPRTKNKENG